MTCPRTGSVVVASDRANVRISSSDGCHTDADFRGRPQMNGFVPRALCLITCLLSLLVATPASAQFAFTSTINGAVTDESGGALPGVTVTLSGAALQVQQTTVTDADGRYRFLELRAGTYDLRYELAG